MIGSVNIRYFFKCFPLFQIDLDESFQNKF